MLLEQISLELVGRVPCKKSRSSEESMQCTPNAMDHALKKTGCVLCSLEFGKWG